LHQETRCRPVGPLDHDVRIVGREVERRRSVRDPQADVPVVAPCRGARSPRLGTARAPGRSHTWIGGGPRRLARRQQRVAAPRRTAPHSSGQPIGSQRSARPDRKFPARATSRALRSRAGGDPAGQAVGPARHRGRKCPASRTGPPPSSAPPLVLPGRLGVARVPASGGLAGRARNGGGGELGGCGARFRLHPARHPSGLSFALPVGSS